jgi:two-component system, NarL family, response regulator NreC
MAIRILIADDHGVMRGGLRALLEDEPGIEVVGEACSGEEVIALTEKLRPDIVLMDIGMPGVDGIAATRAIKTTFANIHVLVLSVYEDESLLREAIQVGAAGYIIKRAAEEELISAIKAVSRGDMYIHPAITRLLFSPNPSANHSEESHLESLSPRELEVLGYLARGYTNRQIAETLYISTRTVESHRANIMGKLGIKNRIELVEYAKKYGLMDQ